MLSLAADWVGVKVAAMKFRASLLLTLLLLTNSARAFSLLGPYADWMQPTNGFRYAADIGGPMNLGEEYRWNVPVLTYTFDQSFLDYFGANGVAAVEHAIQILNALPPASQLDPANYPPETAGWNYQAQALNLTDLKSKTLATLLEQLGLAQPTRYTFNMRNFWVNNGILLGPITIRNFDALDYSPTNRVNDSEYDYIIQITTNGQAVSVTAEEVLIDPTDIFQPAVADNDLGLGEFYTGLTRDDVSGLRYLLHTNNSNFETLLPGVHGINASASTYVDQSLRPGVDKITFVRRDYDGFIGQLFTPYTNQFTDYYISNNTVMAQQLERVITEPDIVFSAGGGQGLVTNAQITRTGTSNWWNSVTLLNGNGPGLIRPPIKLTYSKPVEVLVTRDDMPGSADGYRNAWGSFDGSANEPVVYPQGAAASDLTLNLRLMRNDSLAGNKSWQISQTPQESIVVQTSTNLINWTPHLVFFGGKTVEWLHHCSDYQRYFRIVPQ
jgi:hypothetical protein